MKLTQVLKLCFLVGVVACPKSIRGIWIAKCYSCDHKSKGVCDKGDLGHEVTCNPGEECGTSTFEEWSKSEVDWVQKTERFCMDPERDCDVLKKKFANTDRKEKLVRAFYCSTCKEDLCNNACIIPPSFCLIIILFIILQYKLL